MRSLVWLGLLVPLGACDGDRDSPWGPVDELEEECFLEVLNCDDQVYLVYLDGENIGTLPPGDGIETVPGLERLEACDTLTWSGATHNLDIRTKSSQPLTAASFAYDDCSSMVVIDGQVIVDCEHVYCSYWSH